jgi:hypothetical protein
LLAQLELRVRRPAQAMAALVDLPLATISPELQALAHYWRAEAREASTPGSAGADHLQARQSIERAEQGVPMDLRQRYLSRRDLQAIANLKR